MEENDPSMLWRQFGSRLGRTSRLWRQAIDRRLSQYGLTEATWLPLTYAARADTPPRQKDLAQSIGIDCSSLVRLVDALDNAGLVERLPDEDRRAKLICLTERGRAVFRQVDEAISSVRAEILDSVGAVELASMLNVLERVCATLERNCAPTGEEQE